MLPEALGDAAAFQCTPLDGVLVLYAPLCKLLLIVIKQQHLLQL
jgi:hypothetical protein